MMSATSEEKRKRFHLTYFHETILMETEIIKNFLSGSEYGHINSEICMNLFTLGWVKKESFITSRMEAGFEPIVNRLYS